MHRLLLALLLTGSAPAAAQMPVAAERFIYEDLAGTADIPVLEYTLLGVVLAGDQVMVRRHA